MAGIGIDIGSTATKAVVADPSGAIAFKLVIPTGFSSVEVAEQVRRAFSCEGFEMDEMPVVATGYGRVAVPYANKVVTEITCHAKGAHFLNPAIRSVIDIGGQDSKAIKVEPDGSVSNFVMNDKCAAGTGRFLEMMARTLEISLEDISTIGLKWKEEITISSMCTVFADSEVVSLVAQNKALPDIVHGLNQSVATRAAALFRRIGGAHPCMMTGGVSRNRGVVGAIEEKIGQPLYIHPDAQLCGALGAALFALEMP